MEIVKPTTPKLDIHTFFNDTSFDDYTDYKIILKGIFAEFDTRNGNNGRIYSEEMFRRYLDIAVENLE